MSERELRDAMDRLYTAIYPKYGNLARCSFSPRTCLSDATQLIRELRNCLNDATQLIRELRQERDELAARVKQLEAAEARGVARILDLEKTIERLKEQRWA